MINKSDHQLRLDKFDNKLKKALQVGEVSAKSKHNAWVIKTLVDCRSTQFFWEGIRNLTPETDSTQCWKVLVLLHQLIANGPQKFLAETYDHERTLRRLKEAWKYACDPNGELIGAYIDLFERKLILHRKVSAYLKEELKGDGSSIIVRSDGRLLSHRKYIDGSYKFRHPNCEVSSAYLVLQHTFDFQEDVLIIFDLFIQKNKQISSPNQIRFFGMALPFICSDVQQLYHYSMSLLDYLHQELDLETTYAYDTRFLAIYKNLSVSYPLIVDRYREVSDMIPTFDLLAPPSWIQRNQPERIIKQPIEVVKKAACTEHIVIIEAQRNEIELLKTEIEYLKEQLLKWNNYKVSHSKDIDQLKIQLQTLTESNEKKDADMKRFKLRAASVIEEETRKGLDLERAAHTKTQTQLQELKTMYLNTKQKCESAIKNNADAKMLIDNLRKNKESTTSESSQLAEHLQSSQRQVKELEAKLSQLTTQLDAANNSNSSASIGLENQLTELKESLKSIELKQVTDNEAYLNEKNRLQDMLDKERSAHEALVSRNSNNILELKRLSEEAGAAKRESEQLRRQQAEQNDSELARMNELRNKEKREYDKRIKEESNKRDELLQKLNQSQLNQSDYEKAQLLQLENMKQELKLQMQKYNELVSLSNAHKLKADASLAYAQEQESIRLKKLAAELSDKNDQDKVSANIAVLNTSLNYAAGKLETTINWLNQLAEDQGLASALGTANVFTTVQEIEGLEGTAADLKRVLAQFANNLNQGIPSDALSLIPEFTDKIATILKQAKLIVPNADASIAIEISEFHAKFADAAIELLHAHTITQHELSNIPKKVIQMSKCGDTFSEMTNNLLKSIQRLISDNGIENADDEDLELNVTDQMQIASNAIKAAAERLKKLIEDQSHKEKGVKLDVNQAILSAATALMNFIQLLIEQAAELQKEIVAKGAMGLSLSQFYRKNSTWVGGFIAAAKTVGISADFLVESAEHCVTKDKDYERMTVSAHDITSNVNHLVTAARVKADANSDNLRQLERRSGDVREGMRVLIDMVQKAVTIIEAHDKVPDNLNEHQLRSQRFELKVKEEKLHKELLKTQYTLKEMNKLGYA